MLMHQMAKHLDEHGGGRDGNAKLLLKRAEEAHRQSDLIRTYVTEREPLAAAESD